MYQNYNTNIHTCIYPYMYTIYMKIHVSSMLVIGVDKHTQQTNTHYKQTMAYKIQLQRA